MKQKTLSIAILSIFLVSAMFSACSVVQSQTPESQVTLAGGGKNYRGVFAGGKEDSAIGKLLIWDNIEAYTDELFEWPDSGWTYDRMSRFDSDSANLSKIKAAIDKCKPGGETPLKAEDEFQFVYVGHGPTMDFIDGELPTFDPDPEPNSLAEWLSGFAPSVSIAVIFNSCGSKLDANILAKPGRVTDSNGKPLDSSHLGIAWSAAGADNYLSFSLTWWWPFTASFMEKLTDGVNDAMGSSGVAVMKDVIKNYVAPTVKEQNTGDNDNDTKIDEDGAILRSGPPNVIDYDDDGDGEKDEDPSPQEGGYIGPEDGFGGIVIPVDKFGLLAPYIGLTSTIIVATVATAIYFKRVKRRKEK